MDWKNKTAEVHSIRRTGEGKEQTEDAGGHLSIDDLCSVYTVCDGRRGDGVKASRHVTFEFNQAVTKAVRELKNQESRGAVTDKKIRGAVEEILVKMNDDMQEQQVGTTTYVSALQIGKKMYVIAAGDTPLYVKKKTGVVERVTMDETVTQPSRRYESESDWRLVVDDDKGPSNYLGYSEFNLKQWYVLDMEEIDGVLLTTDGLTSRVSDDELKTALGKKHVTEGMRDIEQLIDNPHDMILKTLEYKGGNLELLRRLEEIPEVNEYAQLLGGPDSTDYAKKVNDFIIDNFTIEEGDEKKLSVESSQNVREVVLQWRHDTHGHVPDDVYALYVDFNCGSEAVEAELATLRDDLKRKAGELAATGEQYDRQEAELRRSVEELQVALGGVEQERDDLQGNYDAGKGEWDVERTRFGERLEELHVEQESTLGEFGAETVRLEERAERAEALVRKKANQVDAVTGERDKAIRANLDWDAAYHRLEGTHSELTARYDQLLGDKVAVDDQLSGARGSVVALERTVGELRGELTSKDERIGSLEETARALLNVEPVPLWDSQEQPPVRTDIDPETSPYDVPDSLSQKKRESYRHRFLKKMGRFAAVAVISLGIGLGIGYLWGAQSNDNDMTGLERWIDISDSETPTPRWTPPPITAPRLTPTPTPTPRVEREEHTPAAAKIARGTSPDVNYSPDPSPKQGWEQDKPLPYACSIDNPSRVLRNEGGVIYYRFDASGARGEPEQHDPKTEYDFGNGVNLFYVNCIKTQTGTDGWFVLNNAVTDSVTSKHVIHDNVTEIVRYRTKEVSAERGDGSIGRLTDSFYLSTNGRMGLRPNDNIRVIKR
jgi:serine/threonine protein phosphatase PrpC